MESAICVQRVVQGKLRWFSVKGECYFVFADRRVIVLVVLLLFLEDIYYMFW